MSSVTLNCHTSKARHNSKLSRGIFSAILPGWAGLVLLFFMAGSRISHAAVIEFNSSGGTNATNGLHFYIEDTTHIQVKRLNNTGQVYAPGTVPPSTNLDNGVFLRANGKIYGPDHNVASFAPTGGMYNTYSITPTSPANPSSSGVQQTATAAFGITSGPQVSVVWKYLTPYDYLTAEVTLVIPASYPVTAANPVRYYHAFDTYLGGSDNGCGVRFTDSNGKLVVGTYPPVSGTSCPSSTSVPSGVSVVESFRERSGLTFSNYCASDWGSFWVNGGNNCSVLQSANMSNTIVTTYQDTGIGIQYNFTAPGTYTFSYDFVVGSTAVPPYDHLEIRHPGTGNLCPTDITVLACTSNVIPCPAANIVNSGTLTGSVTTTPTSPAISQSPASFTLGSSASTATVTLQGTAPGGTYTLKTTGLSKTPASGTLCWNTTTLANSCTFVVNNSPCVKGFECMETGVAYSNLTSSPTARNPLYTKLAASGFKFDVVALQDAGVVASSYAAAANVTVELFDDSASPAPACSAYATPVASQAITFVAADAGRKTLASNFTVGSAYRKLRCRVRDNNLSPVVYGCSSDDFAVRPQSFSLSQSGLASAPFVAGSNFLLTASSGVAGYNGTPAILPSRLKAADSAAGAQFALGSGMLTLTDAANTAVTDAANNVFAAASGSPAASVLGLRYQDVGYLNFTAGAVMDNGYTAIDQTADCIVGSGSNTATGGKFGCEVWNSVLSDIGRFRPDHFRLTSSLSAACNAGTSGTSADDFTYMSDAHLAINATVKAESSQNLTATRYGNSCPSAGSCKLSIAAQNNATQIDISRLQPLAGLPAGTSLFGTGATSSYQSTSWVNGVYAISGTGFQYTRGSTPDGAYDQFNLNFSVADPDSIGFSGSSVSANTKIRYGRLKMQNAYGSELLSLPVALEAQYWNGSSYSRNQQDSCTVVAASSIAMVFDAHKNLSACETQLSLISTLSNGKTTINLSKPGAGNNGSVDLSINLNAASGSTCNSATASSANSAALPWFGVNPTSRATFGIYKTPVIYMRENF